MTYVVKKAGNEGIILDIPEAVLSIAFTLPVELLVPETKVWRRIFRGDSELGIVEEAVINDGNRILISLCSREKDSVEA